MCKKGMLAALCLATLFLISGCWNYKSLSEIAIVSAVAVDMDPVSGEFDVLFEIVDLSGSVKQTGPKPKLVESKGKTVFDAARNAKMKLERRLYFGNNQILIISEELAKSGHLEHMIDWFLRDAELRETVHIIVSQEKTAAELLRVKGMNNPIVGYELERIISNDETVTSSINNIKLYQIYDTLHTKGLSLTLPAFHKVFNSQEAVAEANGIAVFKEKNLVGYLTPLESKYDLFIRNEVKGGILTLPSKDGMKDDTSLEISQNNTKTSYQLQDGKLSFSIDTETRVYLAETDGEFNALDKEKVASLEAAAGAKLKGEIEAVLRKVQQEFQTDIFGFGNDIRKKDYRLWSSLSDQWDMVFSTMEILVNSKVTIANSAFIKNTVEEDTK